ncbi:efflux RND transporter periplasmic adaptor subunit [Roseococcus sp. SDR]|uniref:efflux RND transporter periplasmic adaptor subunit n=1 Tax=Roseococcus sp. SDR TaxID=2835532 RepID=UPI001BCADCF1|nr:efflux RND transporter periplasmic adaptor subunit [Roseococcus sp. SDR]MBS7791515.1 efflux RND transporter periplasmic adaptor subunit [Roseococcus sp. SDR]MBV1846829.1 efflux RND transporter periplasmic adaptor subunit [Roseococcus sp. SDR]
MRPSPLLLLLLTACLPEAKTAAPAPEEPPRPVQVAEIRHLPADAGPSFTGVVRARREADVALRAGGRIAERLVDLGAEVSAGQVLFRLDPRDLELALRAAEADVLSAEATAAQAVNDAARSRALVAAGHVAAAFHEQREATARAATQRLAAARAQRDLARNRLDYAELRAPAAGRVTAILAEAGQVVAEGAPVLRLADPSEREVLVQLPETAIGAMVATARFWARPEVALPVRLREVAAQADPNMRTYAARFALPDAPDWARLGMTATIQIAAEQAAPSARIPLSALHDRGQGPMVWRLAGGGSIEAAPVTVLGLSESMATIRTQLPEGTRIVAMGAQLLAPDSRVRPVEQRLAGAMR